MIFPRLVLTIVVFGSTAKTAMAVDPIKCGPQGVLKVDDWCIVTCAATAVALNDRVNDATVDAVVCNVAGLLKVDGDGTQCAATAVALNDRVNYNEATVHGEIVGYKRIPVDAVVCVGVWLFVHGPPHGDCAATACALNALIDASDDTCPTPAPTCFTQDQVDAAATTAYARGVASVTPEDGVTQDDVDIAAASIPTPAYFDLKEWTCDTEKIPGFCWPSDIVCWVRMPDVPLTITCSKKAGALSAGDGDTSGGMAVNEDLTVPEREQLRSACAAFAASGNADLPASAAAGTSGLTPEVFASICKSVTSMDDTDALAIASTASAANTADLETTILNLKISLAVVSTLLAIGILHTLHQSTMSTQGNPATPTVNTTDNANDDGIDGFGAKSYRESNASISEI